jgi:hypothetical protein
VSGGEIDCGCNVTSIFLEVKLLLRMPFQGSPGISKDQPRYDWLPNGGSINGGVLGLLPMQRPATVPSNISCTADTPDTVHTTPPLCALTTSRFYRYPLCTSTQCLPPFHLEPQPESPEKQTLAPRP